MHALIPLVLVSRDSDQIIALAGNNFARLQVAFGETLSSNKNEPVDPALERGVSRRKYEV